MQISKCGNYRLAQQSLYKRTENTCPGAPANFVHVMKMAAGDPKNVDACAIIYENDPTRGFSVRVGYGE